MLPMILLFALTVVAPDGGSPAARAAAPAIAPGEPKAQLGPRSRRFLDFLFGGFLPSSPSGREKPISAEELTAALGKPDELVESTTWAEKDDKPWQKASYKYPGFVIDYGFDRNEPSPNRASSASFTGAQRTSLAFGLKIGSSSAEIINALGEPTRRLRTTTKTTKKSGKSASVESRGLTYTAAMVSEPRTAFCGSITFNLENDRLQSVVWYYYCD